jgi:alkaline phosphatase D
MSKLFFGHGTSFIKNLKKTFILTLFLVLALTGKGQNYLQSGPMNGYSEMREVAIWVQMNQACIVELVYWSDSIPDKEFTSAPVVAEPDKAFAVKLIADSVQPGLAYNYSIYANGRNQTSNRQLSFQTQPLWRWRTSPPPFKMALGSCTYINEERYDRPGKAYGGDYQIFESIAEKNPDMMLWLGDNVYLREADWFTRTGILERYTHTRGIPEMQNLLSAAHHYAIWDDHDYGPNDANRSFPHKDKTLDAFKLFWANNGFGTNDLGGITSAFQFHDAHFYLLDNRWHRTDPNLETVEEQVFGKQQIDWLIENLKYSRAPFKFVAVGGQILNDAKVYENYANYEVEREYLLNRIEKEKIKNVIFLTGDRHHTELSQINRGGIIIYDLTISPLTSGFYDREEANSNRIDGTKVNQRNFGLISVYGEYGERAMKIEVFDSDGILLWERVISSQE